MANVISSIIPDAYSLTSQPPPRKEDSTPSQASTMASPDVRSDNWTEESVTACFSFLENLITAASPEVQDEAYAPTDAYLPSTKSISKLKKTWEDGQKGHWNSSPRGFHEELSNILTLIQDQMQKGLQALPELVRQLDSEISLPLDFKNPNTFLTIFTDLHAHNVLCVGEALDMVNRSEIKTRAQLHEKANWVADRLTKERPRISPLSLKQRGMTSIPREISYARLRKRELMIQHVEKASYASLAKKVWALFQDAVQKFHGPDELSRDSDFDASVTVIQTAAASLENCSAERFDDAYVCLDPTLQKKLQGIMLTKKKKISSQDRKVVGTYLMVVELATHPQNIASPTNFDSFSHVSGCGTALISYAARECVQHNLAGIYLDSTRGGQAFYERLGFEYISDEEIKTQSKGTPMVLSTQKIKELFSEGKLRVPGEST